MARWALLSALLCLQRLCITLGALETKTCDCRVAVLVIGRATSIKLPMHADKMMQHIIRPLDATVSPHLEGPVTRSLCNVWHVPCS